MPRSESKQLATSGAVRALKFCAALVANTFIALIGTAVINTAIGPVFRPHTLSGILVKEWTLSIVIAFAIGVVMWRTWRTPGSKWVWVLPAIWFGVRALLALGEGNLWFEFSGLGCSEGIRSVECRNFFIFTIPLLRGLSYSLGAYLSGLMSSNKALAVSD